MNDVADPEEYARALQAISGVIGPDPNRANDYDLERALALSRGETIPSFSGNHDEAESDLEKAIRESRETERLSKMTEDEQLAYVLAASTSDNSADLNIGSGSPTHAPAGKGKGKQRENSRDLVELDRYDVGNAYASGSGAQGFYRDDSDGKFGQTIPGPSRTRDFESMNEMARGMTQLISDSEEEDAIQPARRSKLGKSAIGSALTGAKQREMQRWQAVDTSKAPKPVPAHDPDQPIVIISSDEDEPGPSSPAQPEWKAKRATRESMKAATIAVANGASLLKPVNPEAYRDTLLHTADRKKLALEAEARRNQSGKRKRDDTPSGSESETSEAGANGGSLIRPANKKKPRPGEANTVTISGGYRLDGKAVPMAVDDDEDGPTGEQAIFAEQNKVERLLGSTFQPERGSMCWNGEVRSTYIAASRTRSSRKTWRIGDVIGDKKELKLAICAAYCWDDEWVTKQFPDMRDVPFIRIMSPAKNQPPLTLNGINDTSRMPGAINCAPFMLNYGCMHMKFMLLFYHSGRLRIVISSGNMVNYDWERIENIAFVQDLAPMNREVDRKDLKFPEGEMPRTFRKLFGKFSVSQALQHLAATRSDGEALPLSSADDYLDFALWDWSRITAQIVVSEPGSFVGAQVDAVGMTRISKIVREQHWVPRAGEDLVADFQSSSLMEFRERWSDIFYRCLGGTDPTELGRILGPIRKQKKDHRPVWPPIKVLYPSLQTVEKSHGGRIGGGTMFCKDKKHYRPDTKRLFYDSNSLSGRNLQHTKMIIARFVYKKVAKHYIEVPPLEATLKKENKEAQTTDEPTVEATAIEAAKGEARPTIASRHDDFAERNPIDLEPKVDKMGVGGWWYMGSHNFSKAAWGQLSWGNGVPRLFINNYEMGLVFPIARTNITDAVQRIAPWHHPPRKYGRKDMPWMQDIHLAPHVPALMEEQQPDLGGNQDWEEFDV